MKYLIACLVLSAALSPSAALAQGCGGCPNAGTSSCGQQALPASVKLLSLTGDTVDLVKELKTGPRALFTFTPDSAGKKVAAAVQQAWLGLKDSTVSVVGVVCGVKKDAQAAKQELKLSYPLVLDQGCAGSLVLGLAYCPGAVFVRKDGTVAGRAYVFTEEVIDQSFAAMFLPAQQTDPVCKMTVDPKAAAASSEYQGRAYYFCSQGCKDAFAKNPQKYLGN
jgi:YHS domain-containing protein